MRKYIFCVMGLESISWIPWFVQAEDQNEDSSSVSQSFQFYCFVLLAGTIEFLHRFTYRMWGVTVFLVYVKKKGQRCWRKWSKTMCFPQQGHILWIRLLRVYSHFHQSNVSLLLCVAHWVPLLPSLALCVFVCVCVLGLWESVGKSEGNRERGLSSLWYQQESCIWIVNSTHINHVYFPLA